MNWILVLGWALVALIGSAFIGLSIAAWMRSAGDDDGTYSSDEWWRDQ